MRVALELVVLGAVLLTGLAGEVQAFQVMPPLLVPEVCGPAVSAEPVVLPLPPVVTGRVSFYAAQYDPLTMRVQRSLSLGAVNERQLLSSAFKPLVVELVFREVDAGRLALNTALTTTPETQSIEAYPAGTNTLQTLARRALVDSDNTASDLLLLALGPEKFTRSVQGRSPCTSVYLTSKAAWAAQGGLQAGILGEDLLGAAERYGPLNPEEKLLVAALLNQEAMSYTADQVSQAIDTYFRGPLHNPTIDLAFQHTSTAKAFTDLVARVYSGRNLQPGTRKLFREFMGQGCCKTKHPNLNFTYWAAKAGSGWRTLSLTGYVELEGGRVLAYTYLNDLSDSLEDMDMEAQIQDVVPWIEANLLSLQETP